MNYDRSEDDYIVNDILPFLASNFGYPIHDSERIKIKSVPIFRPSGSKSGSAPDIVYYHNQEPILLVEAKRKHKSHAEALKEALNYLKNFPIEHEEYAPSGLPPKILSTTVGLDIKFYKWSIDYSKPIPDFLTEEVPILSYESLLDYYGYGTEYKPRNITEKEFKTDFFDELVAIFRGDLRVEKITPEVIKRVAYQVLNYLEYDDLFTGQYPYVQLNLQSQKAVRDLLNRFDLRSSLGAGIAKEFRKAILRAFQGGGFNQYLTEQCVIVFMVNLFGNLAPETKVLDFECGSGGFLAAVIDKGVEIENIRGVDIDELPYIVAKTYLALYFKKPSVEDIEALPIKKGNGLLYQGDGWDLVIGNPAGGSKYEHGDFEKIEENLNLDLDGNGRRDSVSEYNLSIQQAVNSTRVGGKFCLVLPEGFFSNSNDEYLRKFVSKYCKVLAIVSLPRGVFKKGTSTRQQQRGSQTSSQKMSILYAEKISVVDKNNPIGELDFTQLEYPIFLASISEPESKSGKIERWLEPELNVVWQQWQEWQQNQTLIEIPKVEIKENLVLNKVEPSLSLFDKVPETKEKNKQIKTKSETRINESLEDLFK